MQSHKVNIDNHVLSIYSNLYVHHGNDLIFANIIGTERDIKIFQQKLRDRKKHIIRFHYYSSCTVDSIKNYKTEKYKDKVSGLTQLVIKRKGNSSIATGHIEDFLFVNTIKEPEYNYEYRYDSPDVYHYNDIPEELIEKTFALLKDHSSIPLLEEWKKYLVDELLYSSNIRKNRKWQSPSLKKDLTCYRINLSDQEVLQIIEKGLENRVITMKGARTSDELRNITGMNEYIESFATQLTKKIQENFTPKFDPKTGTFDKKVDYFFKHCQSRRLNFYHAQKSTIQAVVNNLRKNDVTLMVGEMSSGKTSMSLGAIYGHTNKEATTNIIICPAHIPENWKFEIQRYMPNSEVKIVSNFSELMDIEKRVYDKSRKTHLFIILSMSSAKNHIYERPTALYDKNTKTYRCPVCFKKTKDDESTTFRGLRRTNILTKHGKVGTGRDARYDLVPMTHMDFAKKTNRQDLTTKNHVDNTRCRNTVEVYKNGEKTYELCDTPLWAAFTSQQVIPWVKLGSAGWVHKDALADLYAELEINRPERADKAMYNALLEYNDDPMSFTAVGNHRYSISRYIKDHWKHKVDYLIADEIHEMKGGDTKQGGSFGHLTRTAKKTIGLTGTLLNGKASSMFHLLYRCYPNTMIEKGYSHNSGTQFFRTYGVVESTKTYRSRTDYQSDIDGKPGAPKELPGVSPLIFTDFLLENCAFITLDDMREGMVSYKETPVAIEMSTEIAEAYRAVEAGVRQAHSDFSIARKTMGQNIKLLMRYPDHPYNNSPIMHPDTNEVIFAPPVLESAKEERTPKEERLLELVKEKIENDEHVLVYYEHTHITNIGDRLQKMFKEEDIKSYELDASRGKAVDRGALIQKQVDNGVKVLITNPKNVATGFNLLDFTSIIFFEVTHNIFTLRQASRRSWRLTQTRPVEIHFLYYQDTAQEQAINLIARKLQASLAVEGRFTEEGLQAMSETDDMLMQIANNLVNNQRRNNNVVRTFNSHEADEEKLNEKTQLRYIMPDKPLLPERHSRSRLNSGQRFVRDLFRNKHDLTEIREKQYTVGS